MKIKSILIDDDPFIHDLMQDELKAHAPDVDLVGRANNGLEGLAAIKKYEPELVFLDVEMPDMTGFDMLSKIENIDFQVIFVTSFGHYAIKAIRFNALDYLVKPVDKNDLVAAIERYKETAENQSSIQTLKDAVQNFRTDDPRNQSLLLQLQDGEKRIRLRDIVRVEGVSNYSHVHTTDGKRVLTSKTLGSLEEILDEDLFFRCHKSHLINVVNIEAYDGKDSIVMVGGTRIQISRRRIKEFKDWYFNNRFKSSK